MNKQKSLVYGLIVLLLVTGTLCMFTPAQAETWTDINLPYTITEGGNYRIVGSFNGSGTALCINASNVVVDGQNKLISLNQLEGDTAIAIEPNSRNVLLKNINETSSDYGVYAREGNFTVTDSLFTDNNSTAIFAFNVTDFAVETCRLSNNTYGFVTVDCSNFTVDDSHIKNNTKGVVTVLSTGITVKSSYFNNNTEAVSAQNCTNLQLTGSAFVENEAAINATFTTLNASNISATDNTEFGIRLTNSNLVADYAQSHNSTIGLYTLNSNYTITNSSLSSNIAGIFSAECNGTLVDCAIENNSMYAVLSIMDNATTIDDCSIKNSEYGIAAIYSQKLQLTNSIICNNSYGGLLEQQCNSTITHNNFTENGLSEENEDGAGAIFDIETNSTVTDNIFKNNYDALMVSGFENETTSTLTYNYNTFENNTYTFDINYQLTSNITNHQINFYNNLVNDTNYINPISYRDSEYMPTATLYLNTTLQFGPRAYSNGPYIGGNYWAHPNGTGPSQTGADADKDGFIDQPFELFGNATVGVVYDYLPYSGKFDVNQWMNISLPAAIYSPGNYRIMGSYMGEGPALRISASNVTVNGQNYTVANSTSAPVVYIKEGSNITIENMTIQNSYIGILAMSTNTTLRNVNTNATLAGIYLQDAANVKVQNFNATNSLIGLVAGYCNNVNVTGNRILNSNGSGIGAVYFISSNNTIFDNTVCNGTTDGSGIYMYDCNNFQVKSCNLTNNSPDGITVSHCANFTVTDCILNGNGWSSELFVSSNGTLRNCQMSNNSQGIYAKLLNNVTFTGNTFSYNGLINGTYTGGIEAAESNCTVTNNIFDSNYDAYIWGASYSNVTSNQQVYGNIFRNNKYTFFFYNQLPSNYTQQKLYFYNNFVNDSAIVDTVCFNATYSGGYLPFNSSNFAFNTTLQAGARIYSSGPNIGGNFWANPSGTGISQTGTDSDKDGFIDTRYELLNNATIGAIYDNLPMSNGYSAPTTTPTPTPTPTATPTPTPTVTPTSTATPTPTPTVTPTTTPTSTPTATPDQTHTTEEAPWLLIAAVIVVIAAVAAAAVILLKRGSKKPTQ
jgi:parallel beta-helix repeat protein